MKAIGSCGAVLSILVGLLLATPAAASAPPGPRLATVELINIKGSEREEKASPPFVALTTFGPEGGKKRHLLKGKLEEGSTVLPLRDASLVEAEEGRDYEIGELYVATIDGSRLRRVTRNTTKVESSPSWDPSGERIAYVQVPADTSFVPGLGLLFPFGNEIRAMNADGSCKTVLRRSPKVAFYGVAWQPGAGREAGRSSC